MLDVLLLRFDAPWMSFGGEAVDRYGVTRQFPGRAMVTGLLANALGYDHREAERLGGLQRRVRYAVRQDRAGTLVTDFHTVDLGQDFLRQPGWTTRGAPEEREGGSGRTGTHIRYREYLADAVYTVALSLTMPGDPTLDDVAAALREPQRPLFIGRKCCLPSSPLLAGRLKAERLRDALVNVPLASPASGDSSRATAWWPVDEGAEVGHTVGITDDMDWANQIHVGRRYLQEATVSVGNEHG